MNTPLTYRLLTVAWVCLVTLLLSAPVKSETTALLFPDHGAATPVDGEHILVLRPAMEVFGAWRYQVIEHAGGDDTHFNAFTLDRAHLGLGLSWAGFGADITFEAVSSVAEGALLGVAGDSVLARFRAANVSYLWNEWIAVRAGMLNTLTVPKLEQLWGHRVLGRIGVERFALMSAADLGASVVGNFPEGFGSLSIGFYNGEGYAGRELNQGKQVQGALTLRPAAMTEVGKPFTLFASFLYGTEGAGNSRAHRVTGGIFWDQAVFAAGVHTTYIWGVEGDGGQEGVMAEGFLRSRPWEGLILVARGIHYVRDLSLADDTISLFNAAVGYEVAPPLQVFASVEKTWIGHDYANTHHDAQRWSFMISLRGAFAPELHVGLASDTPASALAPTTP